MRDNLSELAIKLLKDGDIQQFNEWYAERLVSGSEVLNLSNVDLSGLDLRGVKLIKANLREANLCYVDLEGANFEGADLTGVEVVQSRLRGTKFGGARVVGVRFSEADTTDADFRNTELDAGQLQEVRRSTALLPEHTKRELRRRMDHPIGVGDGHGF